MNTWIPDNPNGRWFWLAVVVVCLALPLWVGLGRADVENDEAIYSFAVETMLANGDWLTPRSTPSEDAPFLEKPPLKIWLVAGAMQLGLLPRDQFGLRAWDALFGGIAFCYVFAIGARLGGPLAGVAAVLLLFVNRPLLFVHGLRSNNMEAAVVLAYCGGIAHYLSWRAGATRAGRWGHLAALTVYFVLGFMTKFVAALFLPAVLGAVTLVSADGRSQVRRDAGAWLAAACAAAACILPWFVLQYRLRGDELLRVMFGAHVMTRFTASLDPNHLWPWHFYATTAVREALASGTLLATVAGPAWLAARAIRHRESRQESVVVLAWALLPLVAISLLSSKVYHYAYAFLPPLALAGGVFIADAGAAARRAGERLAGARPRGRRSALGAGLAVAVTLVLLPLPAYRATCAALRDHAAPLRTLRDCLTPLASSRAGSDGRGPGVWAEASYLSHVYHYYLRGLGPWVARDFASDPTVHMHLYAPGRYRPVILSRSRYDDFMALVRSGDRELLGRSARKAGLAPDSLAAQVAQTPLGFMPLPEVVIVLPGPYSACGVR